MKNPAKLLAAVAAGLVLTTGAYAQEVAPASNLGPAVVSSSQSENGLFGGLGATGAAALTVGIMVATRRLIPSIRRRRRRPTRRITRRPRRRITKRRRSSL